MIKTLENLLEKQIKSWWDIFTFEHYLKETFKMGSGSTEWSNGERIYV